MSGVGLSTEDKFQPSRNYSVIRERRKEATTSSGINRMISHEIKRHFLLGRKAMTNLDSILKTRDITLQTKVYRVNSMVFPVVMYGCETWNIKKAEHRRKLVLNCGVGEHS